MLKVSEWQSEEFTKENNSKGFWFSHTDDEEGITFLSGAGMPINEITPEMYDLVYWWMKAQDARLSISSTFQAMYEQAIRVYAEDDPLWIESSDGVMDIPYTIEQLGQMFVKKSPPPSLNWLLNNNSSFQALEYDDHNGTWEDWTFEFDHFNAIFYPEYSQWELEVIKTEGQWHKPISLPYKYDEKLEALVVKQDREGFAESWLLPLQDIKEYWVTDWHKDISQGSLVVISQLDCFKYEREAKINAGYHIAEYLPYFFDQEGYLIVSAPKDLEVYGWANSIDIDEEFEEE